MTSFRFNTAESKNAPRAWHDFIDEKFGLSTVNIGDAATFAGEITCSSLGFLTLTEIRATRECSERTKAQVAKAKNESFVVVLLRAGHLKVTQAGRECALRPGMFTLFDCNAPYTFEHVGPTDVLDVSIPGRVVRSRLLQADDLVARPGVADAGLGRVVADVVQSLAREAPSIAVNAADECATRVADLMAVLLDGACGGDLPIGESAVRSAIYRRCVAFIDNNLGDPRLDPARIAAAVGISVRYLHKIFQSSGEAVGDCVRRARLKRSYDDLADRRNRHIKIKEIAFRCGFKSPNHFSDAFKHFHGVSPNEVRSEVRSEARRAADPEKFSSNSA
jgi:AraC family transcriptional regulator, positive regulator of tynA and feaB